MRRALWHTFRTLQFLALAALLEELLVAPESQDEGQFETSRRLRRGRAREDMEVHHGNDTEIADSVERAYQKHCVPLIETGIDIIPYKDAKPCWAACGNMLARSVLDTPFGRAQAWMQDLWMLPTAHVRSFDPGMIAFLTYNCVWISMGWILFGITWIAVKGSFICTSQARDWDSQQLRVLGHHRGTILYGFPQLARNSGKHYFEVELHCASSNHMHIDIIEETTEISETNPEVKAAQVSGTLNMQHSCKDGDVLGVAVDLDESTYDLFIHRQFQGSRKFKKARDGASYYPAVGLPEGCEKSTISVSAQRHADVPVPPWDAGTEPASVVDLQDHPIPRGERIQGWAAKVMFHVGMVLMFALTCFHTWCSGIAFQCALSLILASDAEAMLAPFAWALPWTASIKAMEVPFFGLGISLLVIWLLLVIISFKTFFTMKNVARSKKVPFPPEVLDPVPRKPRKDDHIYQFPLLWSCLFLTGVCACLAVAATTCIWLGVGCLEVMLSLLHSGTHGVHWVCAKSGSAAALGWLPSYGAYAIGGVYAACALFHGLLQDYVPASRQEFTPPSSERGGCISDRTSSLAKLLSKFTSMFSDVTIDCSQVVVFVSLGEPFFALYNLAGLVYQMTLLVLNMMRGLVSEVSFLTVLLQSDSIVHFRSSAAIGFAVLEYNEKSDREASGETFISMIVAVVALFTVPLKSRPQVALFVLSLLLSLMSVCIGVAELREMYCAEAEIKRTTSMLARQIPLNHYYCRQKFAELRKKGLITMLRLSEAVLTCVSLAVCLATAPPSAKAKVAFLWMTICAVMLRYGPDIYHQMRIQNASSWYDWICNLSPEECCEYMFVLPFTCVFLLYAVLVSPMHFVMIYEQPVAAFIHGAINEDVDFGVFYKRKLQYFALVWTPILLSCTGPSLTLGVFDTHAFILNCVADVLPVPASVWDAGSTCILALLKLGLAGFGFVSYWMLLLAWACLKDDVTRWHSDDANSAEQLNNDCMDILTQIEDLCRSLILMEVVSSKQISELNEYSRIGFKTQPSGDRITTFFLQKAVDAWFGPGDRKGRILDPGDPNYDNLEGMLRDCLRSSAHSLLAPSKLGDDIQKIASLLPVCPRYPHWHFLRARLEELAMWLQQVTIFDFSTTHPPDASLWCLPMQQYEPLQSKQDLFLERTVSHFEDLPSSRADLVYDHEDIGLATGDLFILENEHRADSHDEPSWLPEHVGFLVVSAKANAATLQFLCEYANLPQTIETTEGGYGKHVLERAMEGKVIDGIYKVGGTIMVDGLAGLEDIPYLIRKAADIAWASSKIEKLSDNRYMFGERGGICFWRHILGENSPEERVKSMDEWKKARQHLLEVQRKDMEEAETMTQKSLMTAGRTISNYSGKDDTLVRRARLLLSDLNVSLDIVRRAEAKIVLALNNLGSPLNSMGSLALDEQDIQNALTQIYHKRINYRTPTSRLRKGRIY